MVATIMHVHKSVIFVRKERISFLLSLGAILPFYGHNMISEGKKTRKLAM